MSDQNPIALYLDAARTFLDLVARIHPQRWNEPGLGTWDLRSLVGHTGRALVTVLDYCDRPAVTEDITAPEAYYAASRNADPAAIAERGRQAGAELGPEPSAAIADLLTRVATRLDDAEPDALITTIGGGMRLARYLPTRTFELVVHSFDISSATGLPVEFSAPVLVQTLELAARVAVRLEQGPELLQALTGRRALPSGYSIVG